MIEALHLWNNVLFIYYFFSNLFYLGLLILALFSSVQHRRRLASIKLEKLKDSPFVPPVSVVVPAHNEEQTIVESVQSYLSLDYPELEVIVVNDGSRDATLAKLEAAYELTPTDIAYVKFAECKPVRGIYVSRIEPRLVVVDKEPGGCKADAVNAGLNIASGQYVCVVDADAILERDALLRIMTPVMTSHKNVVAAGGIVRAINGSAVRDGKIAQVKLPKKGIEIIQVVEYLRAFLIGREGWSYFNMLMIISGAFGLFQRDLVRKVGGYRPAAIGEDLDLVTRMHRYLLENKMDYQIVFVPDPVCWTEVPSDLKSLGRQRSRWQQGLMDVLLPNRDMLFNPRHGRIGMFALPYHWLFEFLAPWFELSGLMTIFLSWYLGVLNRDFFILFLLFGYGFATLISIGGVLQEEITYRRYQSWGDVLRLIAFCFLEHFPYRPITMWWRLKGTVKYFLGRTTWEPLRRTGFQRT